MDLKPNGRKEATKFVWRQPDTVLTPSQKQSINVALAKDTDGTAKLYFLAPRPEQWVGTLKELLAPAGILPVSGKLWLHLHKASQQGICRLSALPVA